MLRNILTVGTAFSSGFLASYYINKKNEDSLNIDYKEEIPIFSKYFRTLTIQAATPIDPNSNSLVSVQDNKLSKEFPNIQVAPSRTSEIMKHGYPSLDNLRIFDNYILSYDRRNRVASWVFEHLKPNMLKSLESTDRGKSDFQEDKQIHPFFRSTNNDYKGSGYDRGHLAPAANHRMTQKHMDQTFILCNIAPQVGEGFNRDKWNDLEKHVRNLVKKYENVWVCTGPLYLPKRESDNKLYVKYEVIGSQNVAVPTHFFKIALCENSNGNFELFSYVLPNAYCQSDIPLNSYLVPIDSIERAAGLLFFDRLTKSKLKMINGKNA